MIQIFLSINHPQEVVLQLYFLAGRRFQIDCCRINSSRLDIKMRAIVTLVLSLAVLAAATKPLDRLVTATRPRLSDADDDDDQDFIRRIQRDYPETFSLDNPNVSPYSPN